MHPSVWSVKGGKRKKCIHPSKEKHCIFFLVIHCGNQSNRAGPSDKDKYPCTRSVFWHGLTWIPGVKLFSPPRLAWIYHQSVITTEENLRFNSRCLQGIRPCWREISVAQTAPWITTGSSPPVTFRSQIITTKMYLHYRTSDLLCLPWGCQCLTGPWNVK